MNPITYRDARRRYSLGRWQRLRLKVFERDGWRCQLCGKAGRLECDHKINWRDGGAFWDEKNLQAACRGCHIKKTKAEAQARALAWSDRLAAM